MNIGVFFGSGSVEHDISIITGNLITSGLKGLGHRVAPVYITKTGKWLLGEDLEDLKLFFAPNLPETKPGLAKYFLDIRRSVGKLVFKKIGLWGKSFSIDLAFPALHGTYGEDGTIQGMFEMFGLPYVGCGVTASAIAMDKALSKTVIKAAGIPTTKFLAFLKSEWTDKSQEQKQKIKESLRYPLFVKPVHLGSSIGIGKAHDERELEEKVEVAFYYDSKVIVEEAVDNLMDVTCCIIGNDDSDIRTSLLQESLYTKDMFDFEDKYIAGGGGQTGKAQNKLVIPARLDENVTRQIQQAAIQVYKAVGCEGIARVDFLVDMNTKTFFANEINPLPGTLYHHLWKASGLELGQLLSQLLDFAKKRHQKKAEVNFSFESSVLKNFGSGKGKLNVSS